MKGYTERVRILHVGGALTGKGGIEKSVLHLSDGLRERGHDIEIASPPDSWLAGEAWERGFKNLPLPVRNTRDFAAFAPYVAALSAGGYDIINTHFSPDYLVPALAARKVGGSGVVMTRYHVKTWSGLKSRMYGTALYDRILAVSEAVRCALLKGGIPPERVETVYGGVPIRKEAVAPAPLRDELGIAPERPLIGVVSRIATEKGHRFLLNAMPKIAPNAVLIVAGEGPDESGVRALAQSLKLGDRVRFLGWRTDSDAVMAALDIVVQPSLWEEACSLAIMEAMALGKPLVVTRAGGNSELVEQERSGLVVPKNDVAALADALNALLRDPDRRRSMGEAAQERQRDKFSVPAMAEATERAYARLLTESHAKAQRRKEKDAG